MRHMSGFFNMKSLWNTTIPNMLKRIEFVLKLYDIEYEYTFRDESFDSKLNCYKVGKFNVFSSLTGQQFFEDPKQHVYIIFYCNFPEFTYRRSYNFIDRL